MKTMRLLWYMLTATCCSIPYAHATADEDLKNAVLAKDSSAVASALAAGGNPNSFDAQGLSPFHYALFQEDTVIAEQLRTNAGSGGAANVNLKDGNNGVSLLGFMVIQNSTVSVSYLISKSATLDIADDTTGSVPLHHAIQQNGKEVNGVVKNTVASGAVADLLTTAGATVDAFDAQGYTPLHFATINNDASAVSFLLAKGAVKTERTRGQTSLELAQGLNGQTLSDGTTLDYSAVIALLS